MEQSQLGTSYNIEPEVVSNITNFIQQQIRFEALSEQFLPVEQSLSPLHKNYEWYKANDNVGLGYELDVVNPPDSDFSAERLEKSTPVIFSNITMGYDEWRRIQQSRYNLNARLADHAIIMARREDIISYVGDSKHGISAWSSIGTELATQLDVSTPTLATSTGALAAGQLKTSLKYSGIAGPNSTAILELTPDVWNVAAGKTTATESINALQALNDVLKQYFGANSRVVQNHYLDAVATIDNNGVLSSFTEGADAAQLYIQDPRIVKKVTSAIETRVSPLDQTRGITFQPIKRTRRIDVETLGILKEGDVKIA